MAPNMQSPLLIARVATLIIGIIVMGVGLHSHFESAWTQVKFYRICDQESIDLLGNACPNIAMERFYVAMVIIFFILDLVIFVASFLADLASQPLKYVDLGIHGLGALLLFLGAILHIVSAVQINNLGTIGKGWRYEEKIAAGVITFIQGIMFGVVGLLVAKQ